MNRRSFLSLVSVAPVAACAMPALAAKAPNEHLTDIYPIDFDRLERDVRGVLEWTGQELRMTAARLDRLDIAMADE